MSRGVVMPQRFFGEAIAPVDHGHGHRAQPRPAAALRRRLILAVLSALAVVAALAALGMGAVSIAPLDTVAILARAAGLDWVEADQRHETILLHVRLPRVVLAALVGAALGTAGGMLQGLFRNPLVEPGFLGVASGAALGAVGTIVLGHLLFGGLTGFAAAMALPAAAFAGAVGVTFLVYRLAALKGGSNPGTMLLAGIAVGTSGSALTGLLTYMADDEQLRSLTFWLMGSLGGATWERVGTVIPPLLLGILAAPLLARPLNIMLQGEAVARHLGVNVTLVHRAAVAVVGLSVGAAVAVSGIIAFVGLIAPHLVRLLGGGDHRLVLPGGALAGAILMMVGDLLARTVAAPEELPVGILTGAIGGPFFVWLLLRTRTRSTR